MLYLSPDLIGCRIQKYGYKPKDKPFETYDSPRDLGVLIGFSKKAQHHMVHVLTVLTKDGKICHYQADNDSYRIHPDDLIVVMDRLRKKFASLTHDIEEIDRAELIDLD